MGKAFEGIGEVSTSAFGNAAFELGLVGFGECHTDHRFRVVLDNFLIRCLFFWSPQVAMISASRRSERSMRSSWGERRVPGIDLFGQMAAGFFCPLVMRKIFVLGSR